MQRTLFAWRGCIDSFFRGCSLSECLSLKGYFYNKNDFQAVNAERKFFCCIIRRSGVRRAAMAQNCRIPGHAGPVRREDFGGCGGAFRMAGAEKAARWSRQEPALCVFMPGAFLGGRFRNPGFSPGIRGVRTQDRALREDAFWGAWGIFLSRSACNRGRRRVFILPNHGRLSEDEAWHGKARRARERSLHGAKGDVWHGHFVTVAGDIP